MGRPTNFTPAQAGDAELENDPAEVPARVGGAGMLERHWNWFRALLIPVIILAWAGVLIAVWWALGHLQAVGARAAQDAFGAVQVVLGAIVDAILVLILSIYLTANGPAIGRWLRHQTPGGQRHRTRELIAIVNQVVGGYIRGTLA